MVSHTTCITKKEWLSPTTFSIECILPGIKPEPGQFLQVQITNSFDPLLNRPISIADYNQNRVLMIIKVVGRGTEILSEKRCGDELTLFGPFGKRLRIKNRKSLIIAGGIGVAPLFFLAKRLKAQKIDFTFIYGAKSPDELILRKSLEKMAPHSIFITETGSRKKGTALSVLNEIDLDKFEITYACGPRPMLQELKKMNLKLPVYAFCEDFLGCGCGLCLGCAIKYYGSYKRICKDGPVFNLKGIEFE